MAQPGKVPGNADLWNLVPASSPERKNMIFDKISKASPLAFNLIVVALCGSIGMGCSGGGSSGGGGSSTPSQPGNPGNPTPSTNSSPVLTNQAASPASMSGSGGNVTLSVQGSDPDGDTIEYLWSQKSNGAPSVTFVTAKNQRTVQVSIPSSSSNHTYKFECRGFDTKSAPVVVTVQLPYTVTSGGGGGGGGGTTPPPVPAITAVKTPHGQTIRLAHRSEQLLRIEGDFTGLTNANATVTFAGQACKIGSRDGDTSMDVILPPNLASATAQATLTLTAPASHSGSQSVLVNVQTVSGTKVVVNRESFGAGQGKLGIATVSSSGTAVFMINESNGNGHFFAENTAPVALDQRYFVFPCKRTGVVPSRPALALIDAEVIQGGSPIDDIEDLGTNGDVLQANVSFNGEIAALWRDTTSGKMALTVCDRDPATSEIRILRKITLDGANGRPDVASGAAVGAFLEIVKHKFTNEISQNWACFGLTATNELVLVGMTDGKVRKYTTKVVPRHGIAGLNTSTHHDELILVGRSAAGSEEISRARFSPGGVTSSDEIVLQATPVVGTPLNLIRPVMAYSGGVFHIILTWSAHNAATVFSVDFDAGTKATVGTDTFAVNHGARSVAYLPNGGVAITTKDGTNSDLRLYSAAKLTSAQFTNPRVIPDTRTAHALVAVHQSIVCEMRQPGTDTLLVIHQDDFDKAGNLPTSSVNFAADTVDNTTDFAGGAAASTSIPFVR